MSRLLYGGTHHGDNLFDGITYIALLAFFFDGEQFVIQLTHGFYRIHSR